MPQGKQAPPLQTRGLGAEEDGLTLEHFDGNEESDGGVGAGRDEDDGDGTPMIGAGNDLLADEAGAQDRDEGELRIELDAGHERGHGRNDDEEGHGSDIALGFFVALGKEGDSEEQGREQDGEG